MVPFTAVQVVQEEVAGLKDSAAKKDREGRELRKAVHQLSAEVQVRSSQQHI